MTSTALILFNLSYLLRRHLIGWHWLGSLRTWLGLHMMTGRIVVHACKTEHFEGKGERVIPLFGELLPYLREVFEQAQPGAEYVISGPETLLADS